VPPKPGEIAKLFPQLEVIELVGCGGMGIVYKVRQKHLDRVVALKILPPSIARDAAFAERFQREAKALAKLNHPHIIGVYDFGRTFGAKDGWFYFLMEFVDGVNLRQMVHAGSLQPHEALAIVPQICEALQYAHDQGIVHRDIKPENILVDRQGRVKIADFGLAKLVNAASADFRLTGTHQALGTPLYMAPEQIERTTPVDHRADIYSLGVVFYEMLTGELPLGRFAPPSKKVHIDVRLDDVVLRTLEKEPDLRYQQVSQVQTEVESIARHPRLPKQRRWLTRDGKPLVRLKVIWWTFAACVVLSPVALVVLAFAIRMAEIVKAEEQRNAAMVAEQGAKQQAAAAYAEAQAWLPAVSTAEEATMGMAPPGAMGDSGAAMPGMRMGPAGGHGAIGMISGMDMGSGMAGVGGEMQSIEWDGDKPKLADRYVQALQLDAPRRQLFDAALQEAVREIQRLEEQNTKVEADENGMLVIVILPVENKDRLRLEDRFWTKVDTLLDDKDAAVRTQRRTLARQYIPLYRVGVAGVERIGMWQSGTFFQWRGNQFGSGAGPDLPPMLMPLWRKYSHLLDNDAVGKKPTTPPDPPTLDNPVEKPKSGPLDVSPSGNSLMPPPSSSDSDRKTTAPPPPEIDRTVPPTQRESEAPAEPSP
jgi:tRNA A-37 threonylcarbamoyl transferase component Bud32